MFLLNYLINSLKNMNKDKMDESYAFTEYVVRNMFTGEKKSGMTLCPRRYERYFNDYVPDDMSLLDNVSKKYKNTDPEFVRGILEFESVSYVNIPKSFCILNNLN